MPTDSRPQIQTALADFARGDLQTNARELFAALGYRSNKQLGLSEPTVQGFLDELGDERFNAANALVDDWRTVDLVMQLTETELHQSAQRALFDAKAVDLDNYHSYLIFCVELAQPNYSRTALAKITREINKLFKMPALVLFKHGDTLTLSVIDRRLHKRDADKDVLEKVTLIKDIRLTNTHRAHIEILFDLALPTLIEREHPQNFSAFHDAWRSVLDTSELNKKFFRELANWFYWAQAHVTFPDGAGKDETERNATSLIRLITRLIFTWFIQEKDLVPADLFDENKIKALLKDFDPKSSTYYKAILQNLFFGTLNTEMKTEAGAPNRKFIQRAPGFHNPQHMIHNLYRYENAFKDPAAFLKLMQDIPFLNGGLFECLDREPDANGKREIIRIDGFSERIGDQLDVPNYLFFAQKNDPKYFTTKDNARLNETFGTKNKNYEVRGLLRLLHRYKFTIDENTPIEQEVALDPELLGKVFENLLAAYNPETGVTARKQTGSFYTPREIVNYMVDESLIAYLEERMKAEGGRMKAKDEGGRIKAEEEDSSFILHPSSLNSRLRHLLSYTTEPHQFDAAEMDALIAAIDELKILDPACGSGAFPMGVLHKLVFILHKLDPDNARWKEKQIHKMSEIPDPEQREKAIQDVEQAFNRNELDYGRKLYLIENCIYGVDIQPIAVQIAKLRAFISLIVDERVDNARPNRGVRPLPNLETKFVAANSLIGIDRPHAGTVIASGRGLSDEAISLSPDLEQKCNDLADILRQYLKVKNPATQRKYLELGEALGEEINAALSGQADFTPLNINWIFTTATSVDALLDRLPGMKKETTATKLNLRRDDIKDKEKELVQVRRDIFNARTYQKKKRLREQDAKLRRELAELLKNDGMGDTTANQLAGWDPYDQNAHAEFFDAEWMFGITGGFDVVIGNPPYGASYSAEEKDYFQKNYLSAKSIPKVQKGSLDTYSLFIDLGLFKCAKTPGSLCYIVPLSYTSSESMYPLHSEMLKTCERIAVSSYSNRPNRIFLNADQRVSIVVALKTDTPTKELLTTKIIKRYAETTIDEIINGLQFVNSLKFVKRGRFPKVGTPIELAILGKISSIPKMLADCEEKNERKQTKKNAVYYRAAGGRYYNIVTNFSTGSTQEKPFFVRDVEADVICALLSSSLYYWLYLIYSDNLHIKSYELLMCPVPFFDAKKVAELKTLYASYIKDLERNAIVKQADYSNVSAFKEYRARLSKPLIDKIDRALQEPFGLSDDEIEFIINYDLKFRTDEED